METSVDIKTDSKYFKYLLNKGFLPQEAIKKIESDKRRGIEPPKMPYEFSLNMRENWWAYGALGAIGLTILYLRFRNSARTILSINGISPSTILIHYMSQHINFLIKGCECP